MEPRRRRRFSGRILALAGTHFFREQRRISRVGWRAGAVQEELPESRRDGPVGILGFGVSLPGAGRGARSWPMALEAGERRHRGSVHAGVAEVSGRLENPSRSHEHGRCKTVGNGSCEVKYIAELGRTWMKALDRRG